MDANITDKWLGVDPNTFYRTVVETSSDPIAVISDDLVLRYVSSSITGLLGWEPADWVGRSVADLLEPENLAIVLDGLTEWNATEHDPDEPEAPVRVLLRSKDHRIIPVDATIRDRPRTGIPGLVVQLHAADASEALSDAVDMILTGADADRVLWQLASLIQHDITRTTAALGSGWNGDRFTTAAGDHELIDLRAPTDADRDAIRYALRSGQMVSDLWDHLAAGTQVRATTGGFRSCWCAPIVFDQLTAALIVWHTDAGPPGVIYATDIKRTVNLTRLALRWSAQQQRLAWDVTHDQLTGLTNRAEFQNRLDRSTGAPRAVLFCDLDDFKPINERLDHRAGDEVLAAVAGRLAGACERCVVARLGGDEFGMLLDDVTGIDEALELAEQIRDVLSDPIAAGRHHATVGVTIGIAFDAKGLAHSDLLLDEADRLLRRGKARGKNQVLAITLGDSAH